MLLVDQMQARKEKELAWGCLRFHLRELPRVARRPQQKRLEVGTDERLIRNQFEDIHLPLSQEQQVLSAWQRENLPRTIITPQERVNFKQLIDCLKQEYPCLFASPLSPDPLILEVSETPLISWGKAGGTRRCEAKESASPKPLPPWPLCQTQLKAIFTVEWRSINLERSSEFWLHWSQTINN